LAVRGALFASRIITVLKFIAAMMTGSSGMMDERILDFRFPGDGRKTVDDAEHAGLHRPRSIARRRDSGVTNRKSKI
jgi:hypothetical protein